MSEASCAATSFPISNSGAWADSKSTIGWLDDDEVAFRGTEGGVLGPEKIRPVVGIWNLAKGVRIYRQHVRTLCVGSGTLAYMLEGDQKAAFFGVPGHEAPIDYRRVSNFTCQLRSEDADPDREIVPLLAEHGVLDCGPRRGAAMMDNAPIVLHAKGAAQGIDVGLKHWDTADIRYYPFKRAYLINSQFYDASTRSTSSPWPAVQARPLWWLTPDGKVTRFNVPAPWNQVTRFYPTLAGIVVSAPDARKRGARFPQDAGLFLILPDGSVQTLLSGVTEQISVAPSGCTVAFIHLQKSLELDSARLNVVRVCS